VSITVYTDSDSNVWPASLADAWELRYSGLIMNVFSSFSSQSISDSIQQVQLIEFAKD